MESILPNQQGHCRRGEKFTDQELDKLLRDLNEFQKTVSMPGSGEGTDIRDFIDSPFTNNMNNQNLAHPPLQYNLSTLLHDFEEFETTMLPPCQLDYSLAANYLNNNQTSHTEIKHSQVMIEEMAEGTQGPDISMSMTSHLSTFADVGGSGFGIGSFVSGDSLGAVSFQGGSSVTFFGDSAKVIRYFYCAQTGSEYEKPYIRRRKKRRYKGVTETEEETARRVERTKIKNREAAAKAHQKKQAHETHLRTQLQKLRKKNGFLKNMQMFLEGHKKVDVSPKPLRRTISGPI